MGRAPALPVRRLAGLGANLKRLRTRAVVFVLGCVLLLTVPTLHLWVDFEADFYKSYLSEFASSLAGIRGHPKSQFDSPCSGFPNTDDIAFVLKTRGGKAMSRLPTHFLTQIQCLPDVLIFSDLEQSIAGHKVYDALDRISDEVRAGKDSFKFYDEQRNCPVAHDECKDDPDSAADLERYMVLNTALRAWEQRPGKKWYVFADDDTYIFWPNLVHWLRHKAKRRSDPFVGSVVMLSGFPFAHGGSGFVLSGAAIEKMITEIPEVAAKYNKLAEDVPYGNMVLAKALGEVGIVVKQAHPMFNGEKPSTVPFGRQHWCQPVFTMSGMKPEEISAAWHFEQERNDTGPVQYRHLFNHYFKPHISYYRHNWNNGADSTCYIGSDSDSQSYAPEAAKNNQKKEGEKSIVEQYAHMSAASCAKVCESEGLDIATEEFTALDTESLRGQLVRERYIEKRRKNPSFMLDRKCFQWRFYSGICCTSSEFSFGSPTEEASSRDEMVTSGWFVRGIQDWQDAMGDCKVDWKEPVTPA